MLSSAKQLSARASRFAKAAALPPPPAPKRTFAHSENIYVSSDADVKQQRVLARFVLRGEALSEAQRVFLRKCGLNVDEWMKEVKEKSGLVVPPSLPSIYAETLGEKATSSLIRKTSLSSAVAASESSAETHAPGKKASSVKPLSSAKRKRSEDGAQPSSPAPLLKQRKGGAAIIINEAVVGLSSESYASNGIISVKGGEIDLLDSSSDAAGTTTTIEASSSRTHSVAFPPSLKPLPVSYLTKSSSKVSARRLTGKVSETAAADAASETAAAAAVSVAVGYSAITAAKVTATAAVAEAAITGSAALASDKSHHDAGAAASKSTKETTAVASLEERGSIPASAAAGEYPSVKAAALRLKQLVRRLRKIELTLVARNNNSGTTLTDGKLRRLGNLNDVLGEITKLQQFLGLDTDEANAMALAD